MAPTAACSATLSSSGRADRKLFRSRLLVGDGGGREVQIVEENVVGHIRSGPVGGRRRHLGQIEAARWRALDLSSVDIELDGDLRPLAIAGAVA